MDGLATEMVLMGDGAAVVKVAGEIDMENAAVFGGAMGEALDAADRVEIDFTRVEFIDSSGLRELVRAHVDSTGRNKFMRLVNITPTVERTLRIVGLDVLLNADLAGVGRFTSELVSNVAQPPAEAER